MLILVAYAGLLIAAVLLFSAKRDLGSLLFLAGLLIAEGGRQFRILGPTYSVEPSGGMLRLTDDSSLFVFLAKSLIMPMGVVVAMIGFLLMAWHAYKSKRDGLLNK